VQEWFNLARDKLFGWLVGWLVGANQPTCSFLHGSCLISLGIGPGRVKDSIGILGTQKGLVVKLVWETLLYWKTVQ
jgi:hypothetical protein